jgi:hypothetical protein
VSTDLPTLERRSIIARAPPVEPRMAVTPAAQPSVTLHVERLVLQGFSFAPRAGAKVEQAFHSEVNRLLGSGELQLTALSAQALDKLRLDDLSVGSNAQPEQVGRALAAALLRGLSS